MVSGALRNALFVPLATSLTATGVVPLCVQPDSAAWMRAVSGGVASCVAPDFRLVMASPADSIAQTVDGTCGWLTARLSPVAVGGREAACDTAFPARTRPAAAIAAAP